MSNDLYSIIGQVFCKFNDFVLMTFSFIYYESALRFILFNIFPSVIRVWILSSKNSTAFSVITNLLIASRQLIHLDT